MPFNRAGQLARHTPTVRPDDPLGLVAENLRAAHCGAIPVLDRFVAGGDIMPPTPEERHARVLGLVDEHDLARAVLPALAQREAERVMSGGAGSPREAAADGLGGLNGYSANGHPAVAVEEPEAVTALTARAVMRQDIGVVPAAFSLHNALLTLERYGSSALPVVDETGAYRGMISRADVVAALGQQVRPPIIGGMATPLGVWLTTGSVSAGAPPLGLFLSGMVMAFCLCLSRLILLFVLRYFNPEWGMMFWSGRLGSEAPAGGSFNLLVTAAETLLFLLILRSLPMAGIHAAEHQTVWAIERGLPLEPEYVARMPRAHPRCGTNLVALGGLILITFQHLPDINPPLVLLSLLFIYLVWRSLGYVLQEWFTTKPATRKQLESGIRAGRALLEKYQAQPHASLSFGMRLFNSGLILAALGMIVVLFAYGFLLIYVVPRLFLPT
ncbi:MAG: DUF1385 domain-containing protein [Armatimonadota bacterium]|nr:DUF1385 domain-containing protein [Armatimonadota bacterium]